MVSRKRMGYFVDAVHDHKNSFYRGHGPLLQMARLARIIFTGYTHHITQRSNCRQDVFFEAGGCEFYLELLRQD